MNKNFSFGGFHLILVPRNPSRTRSFHLHPLTAKIFLFLSILSIPSLIFSVLLSVHFQNKNKALKESMANAQEVLAQKDLLNTRLEHLEKSLVFTEQSLGKLEKAMDVEIGHVKSGLGPIEYPQPLAKKEGNEIGSDDDFNLPHIHGVLNELDSRIAGLHTKADQVFELNEDKIRFLDSTPTSMPVNGWVTSDFGFRTSPANGVYKMHYGLDIAAPVGTTIKAPASGKVVFAEYSSGYGNKVVIDHGFGVSTVYGHASQIFVNEGDTIRRGQRIAAVGSTGSSTGPHVHYEVHVDGIPVNPTQYILK